MSSWRDRLAAAFLPPPPEEGGGEPLTERGWRATLVGLHVVSAGVWLLAVVTVVRAGSGSDRVTALGVLGLLGAAYAFAGAHGPAALHGRRPGP